MTSVVFDSVEDYGRNIGRVFEPTAWIDVDQDMIDQFAVSSRDHGWYHVDAGRAARELPDGRTIAHGMLTLSLLPAMGMSIVTMRADRRAVIYGFDKVRFPAPVLAGSRIRLHLSIVDSEPVSDGVKVRMTYSMELEGSERPALVCDMLMFAHADD